MAKDMRIISGLLKGRQLSFPTDIRPTQNKVRKAVFDCLAQAVEGAEFLELFAGSGAVGIEAISCGAKRVTFVDSDFNSLKVIESNLKRLEINDRHYRIVKSDVFKYLDYSADQKAVVWHPISQRAMVRLPIAAAIAKATGGKTGFDIIFIDPPYRQAQAKNCLLRITACDILNLSGILVIEHHKKEDLPRQACLTGRQEGSLMLFKQKAYSDTRLSFYRAGL